MTVKDTLDTDLSALYDEIADFLTSSPSPQEIVKYRLSEASDQLISDLLEANRTRELISDEQATLDEYAVIERLMRAVKTRAYAKLK